MNISKNIDSIIDILNENKAIDILKIDVQKLTSTVDFMIIASGTSSRHIRGLSEIVMAKAKKNKLPPIGVEGQDGSEWILIDFGDYLVHLMLPKVREFYNIEKLWGFGSIDINHSQKL
jgi:ribosome-associated protein